MAAERRPGWVGWGLGVPHALEFGMLTFAFSIIPAVGAAIVWAPIAVGLALTRPGGAAIVLAVCGLAVIGTVDNLVTLLRDHLHQRCVNSTIAAA